MARKPAHSLPQLGPFLFLGDGQKARCQPLSLVTFFAAAKKVTAAPHRGNARKPTTSRGCQRNSKLQTA
jgi:general secretion pathway protein K